MPAENLPNTILCNILKQQFLETPNLRQIVQTLKSEPRRTIHMVASVLKAKPTNNKQTKADKLFEDWKNEYTGTLVLKWLSFLLALKILNDEDVASAHIQCRSTT